jgi:transposase
VNFSRAFCATKRYKDGMNNGMEAAVRLRKPDRSQMTLRAECDEQLIPQAHPARIIWSVVQKLDLSRFHEPIKARQGVCGRDATDPKLLVALWLYGATRGVGSARELSGLCVESRPYRWLCGGVTVNHHGLSDFRVGHAEALDELFTQVLAALVEQGLVKVRRVSQDGTRVRACAGASSFRRGPRLEQLLDRAKAHMAELRTLLDDPEKSAGLSAKKKAAKLRAAQDRQDRVEAAVAVLPQLAAKQQAAIKQAGNGKYGQKLRKNEPRVSTTDPQTRVMKMPDGGFAPATNVQLAVDIETRAIVGVDVTNAGSDKGQAEPMRKQVEDRTKLKVQEHLMDGGFLVLEEIDRAAQDGVRVLAPPPAPRDPAKAGSEYEPKSSDSVAQADWRQRMAGDEAKTIYKQRAATSETVNADLKTHRGLVQLTVRGLTKAKCVALWCALDYNLMHFGAVLMCR